MAKQALLSAATQYAKAVLDTEYWRTRKPYNNSSWSAAWETRSRALTALMRAAEHMPVPGYAPPQTGEASDAG